jgi:hypothetical protein
MYGTDSGYYSDPTYSTAAIFGQLAFYVIFYLYYSFTLSRIFDKMGIEPWKAWVPVYSSYIFLQAGRQAGFWAVISLIPFFGIFSVIFMTMAAHDINKGFGKGAGYTVLYFFLSPVWLGIFAFGRDEYNDDAGAYDGPGYATNEYVPHNPYMDSDGHRPPPPPANGMRN